MSQPLWHPDLEGDDLPDNSPGSIRRAVKLSFDLRALRKECSGYVVAMIEALGLPGDDAIRFGKAPSRLEADTLLDLEYLAMPTLREQFDNYDPYGEEL